jgi:hypothetical protein
MFELVCVYKLMVLCRSVSNAGRFQVWAWSRSSHPSSQGPRPAGVILGPRMGGTLSTQGTHSTLSTLGTPKVPQKHKLNQIK